MEQIKNYFPQFWGKKSQVKPLCNMLNVANKCIRTRLRKPWLLMLFFNSVAWNIYIYTLLSIELNYLTMEKRNTYIILMTLGVIFSWWCSFCWNVLSVTLPQQVIIMNRRHCPSTGSRVCASPDLSWCFVTFE